MDVEIHEVVATVRSVSGDSLLSQRTLKTIVETVLKAVRAERESETRQGTDRRITNGARDEQEGED